MSVFGEVTTLELQVDRLLIWNILVVKFEQQLGADQILIVCRVCVENEKDVVEVTLGMLSVYQWTDPDKLLGSLDACRREKLVHCWIVFTNANRSDLAFAHQKYGLLM